MILIRRSDGGVVFVERDRAGMDDSTGEILTTQTSEDRIFRFKIENEKRSE